MFQRVPSSAYSREPVVMRPVPPPPEPNQPPALPREKVVEALGQEPMETAPGHPEHEDFVLVPKDIPLDPIGHGALDLKAIFR